MIPMVRISGQLVTLMAYEFLATWPMLYSSLISKCTTENLTKDKNSHLRRVSEGLPRRSGTISY